MGRGGSRSYLGPARGPLSTHSRPEPKGLPKFTELSWGWGCTPVLLELWEAEARTLQTQLQPGPHSHLPRPCLPVRNREGLRTEVSTRLRVQAPAPAHKETKLTGRGAPSGDSSRDALACVSPEILGPQRGALPACLCSMETNGTKPPVTEPSATHWAESQVWPGPVTQAQCVQGAQRQTQQQEGRARGDGAPAPGLGPHGPPSAEPGVGPARRPADEEKGPPSPLPSEAA